MAVLVGALGFSEVPVFAVGAAGLGAVWCPVVLVGPAADGSGGDVVVAGDGLHITQDRVIRWFRGSAVFGVGWWGWFPESQPLFPGPLGAAAGGVAGDVVTVERREQEPTTRCCGVVRVGDLVGAVPHEPAWLVQPGQLPMQSPDLSVEVGNPGLAGDPVEVMVEEPGHLRDRPSLGGQVALVGDGLDPFGEDPGYGMGVTCWCPMIPG